MAQADTIENARADAGHPAPRAGQLGIWRMLLILGGAPLAWSVQIIAGYATAAYACFPKRAPLSQPVFASLHAGLAVLSAAAIAVSLVCLVLAWRSWRATRAEMPGDHQHLLDVGEGRTRFMALSAVISSVLFLFALLLTTSVLMLVQPCGI